MSEFWKKKNALDEFLVLNFIDDGILDDEMEQARKDKNRKLSEEDWKPSVFSDIKLWKYETFLAILSRLRKKGYILGNRDYIITESGYEFIDLMSIDEDHSRRELEIPEEIYV